MISNVLTIVMCVCYDIWWFGLDAYTQKITHNCYECSTVAVNYNKERKI